MSARRILLWFVATLGLLLSPVWSQGTLGQTTTAVVLQGVDPNTLDPLFFSATPEWSVGLHVFETLAFLDFEKKQLLPRLATEWRMLNPTTWQIKLRQGVKFHDGEDFDARAVKFTVERLQDPAVKAVLRFKQDVPISRVDIVDPHTVNIVTQKPIPILPEQLPFLPILAPGYYAQASIDVAATKPIGTGPYRFVRWVRDQEIVLERFDGYWGRKARIPRLVFRPVPEAFTRMSELLTGKADIIVNVPPEQAPIINRAFRAEVRTIQGGRDIYVGIRTDRAPFNDKRVRLALNHAVDVEAILRNLMGIQGGKRLASIANPPNENPGLKPYAYDPARARALLREAGVPEGFKVVIEAPVGRYLKDKEVAEAVTSYLRAVGLDATVQPFEWSAYVARLSSGAVGNLFLLGLGGFFNGQGELFWVHPNLSLSPVNWRNSEFLRVYDAALVEMDPVKRKGLYMEAQRIALEDAPWIFLYKQYDFYGVNRSLKWTPRPDEFILLFDSAFE